MERVNPSEEPMDLPAEGEGASRQEGGMAKNPYYVVKTKGGYPLDEVVSALQKCVRRGLEEEAMYWALELAESGFGQYLWRRLMVIAAEDIGIADPRALVLTTCGWLATKEATKSFTKPPGMKTELLGTVLLYLCRSPKNREGDDFAWYMTERRKRGWRIPVPDFALDSHTGRGRRMKRADAFWWEESSKLHPEVEVEGNRYKAKVRELCYPVSQPELETPDPEEG